jgi:hypothetical protein
MKVSRDGGAATTLALGPANPTGIALDPLNVYWVVGAGIAESGAIMKVPLSGGTPLAIVSGESSLGERIGIDAASVYWTRAEGAIMKTLLDGTETTMLSAGSWRPTYIAVDANSVYWTTDCEGAGDGGGSVMKVSLQGGAPTTIASRQSCPTAIAVGTTHVYWGTLTASKTGPGTVKRAPLDGGEVKTLASGSVAALGLAVVKDWVYWVAGSGGVVRMPIDGGTPVVLSSCRGVAEQLVALGDREIYWLDTYQMMF